MGYDAALSKAWEQVNNLAEENKYSLRMLNDEYEIKIGSKSIVSLSCNIPAKDFVAILILHYLTEKLKGLPQISGEWISFKQLDGGIGYYPAFKKRTIDSIVRKYGNNPEAIFETVERFNAKKAQLADVSVVAEVFDSVPVLITLSRADEEFGPEANMLFDKSIKDIFCTEDVVVLAGFTAANL